MTLPTEKKIALGFGATLLVMLVAGLAGWWNLRRFEASFLTLDHTHQVLNHLGQALTGVLTMETSTREFLLTGRDDMDERYRDAAIAVEQSFRELRRLTADNTSQQARLDALKPVAEHARALMAERIAARRTHGLVPELDAPAFRTDQEAVEQFRRLVDEMSAEENRRLHNRFERCEDARRSTLATIISASAFATVFLACTGLVVQRDFRLRPSTQDSLRELNERLSQHVRERTGQLEDANRAMAREIANRQEAETALRASEQRLLNTLDGMLEGCQLIGPDWSYLYLNDTAAIHGRRHKQELLGRTMPECFPGIERTPLFGSLQRCLERRTTERLEQLFTYPDGSQAWFLLSIQPALEGISILSLDITETKLAANRIRQDNAALEQRVRESTAQLEISHRELEAFSDSVSHDLRAPLRHIDSYAHLLGKHASATFDETARRYLATISASARQMGRMIDDLVTLSRNERAELNCVTLDQNALLADTLATGHHNPSGRPILWEIAPLPAVAANPRLLRQVWANLLENAVKFSRKENLARISIQCRPDLALPGELVFAVSDNGVGFDPSCAEKLFGVFQRLHLPGEFEGTGVGLANVRRIVTRYGGRTWAEGRVDEGATFFFTLPDPATPAPT